MRNVGNRTLIIILIFLIVALIALIGYLIYLIGVFARPPDPEATIYVVDASERMLNTFSDTDSTRLEMAQQFVRENVGNLPDSEITSLHVFGNGASAEDCEDISTLVSPSTAENVAIEIQSVLGNVEPIAREAALIRGAVEALRTLASARINGEPFKGKVTLFIVTSGNGTCLKDSNLIQLTANEAEFDLELIQINIGSDGESDDQIGVANVDNARTFDILSQNDLSDVQGALNNPIAGSGINNPAAPVATNEPPVLATPEQTNTPFPTPTNTATLIPPTATESNTPVPQPTATDSPPSPTPTLPSLPPSGGSTTPTTVPSVTATPPLATLTPTRTPAPAATPTIQPPTVTPSPTSTSGSGSGGGGGNPPTPTPTSTSIPLSRITIADATVSEDGDNAFISVERLDVSSRSVSVAYSSIDLTATAGVDYISVSGTLVWQANEGGSKPIVVPIRDDGTLEGNETFQILISNAGGATIERGAAEVTIEDDEEAEILVGETDFAVSESSNSTQTSINLSDPPSSPVAIAIASSDETICSVPSGSIELNSSNWSTFQLNITINNNSSPIRSTGQAVCQITTGVASSQDQNFAGINPADITITIFDDDAQYVDQSCPDDDENDICNNGFFFRTIQTALSSPIPSTDIYVLSSPHTETNIGINRNVNIISADPASAIIQGADSPQAANGRIFSISPGAIVSLNEFTLQNGFARNADGGAIENQGNLTLNNIKLVSNVTSNSGGAIFNIGTLDITNGSTFESNISQNGCGGAIFNSGPLTINTDENPSFISFVGNQANGGDGGAICNANSGTTAMSRVLMNANSAGNQGGAIFNQGGNFLLEETVISGNRVEGDSSAGGGIYNTNATLVVQRSNLTGNFSSQQGGGAFNDAGGTLRFIESSLTFNISGGDGGAVYNLNELEVENSTFSTNQASGTGGAVYSNGGTPEFEGVTINDNTASAIGGLWTSTQTTIHNTIINNSSSGDCAGMISANYSLISNVGQDCTATGTGNLLNVAASLQGLSDNGSGTQAHIPNGGSPVLGAGDPNNCTPNDQWGNSRPAGGPNCDIGAIEQ